jgi:NADP-dependent aldehyde dehydrogenase
VTALLPADTTPEALEHLLARAAEAAPGWSAAPPQLRGSALRLIAEQLTAAQEGLVALAGEETHLPEARLRGELKRTTFQLELFADVLDEGSFLDVVVDHPDARWPPGARPDLRRMLAPLGPVVVFAGSNFPFAFSVAGGDTASALAAGCPVLVKAHPGHPRLSAKTASILIAALAEAGAPDGVFDVCYGEEAGRSAVEDPRITAGAFTGSLRGGRALFDLACARPVPIPFYAEMGSLNPVFVTRGALDGRRDQVLDGYVASYTLGAGQFCTKPGVLVVPAGAGVEGELAERVARVPAAALLNPVVGARYEETLGTLGSSDAVRNVVAGAADAGAADAGAAGPDAPRPSLLATSAQHFLAQRDELLVECFGPASLLVTYETNADLLELAASFDGQLTATVHGVEGDPVAAELLARLAGIAGRVLWNGWPTGVAVTWAMQHGGPYPATTAAQSTSVGTAAIARFLRPVCYQDLPDSLLPLPLREANPWRLPRRVDGSRQAP